MSDSDRSIIHRLYTERNQAAQLAAALAEQLGIPVGAAEGRGPGWRVLVIDLPAGQVQWVVAPGDYLDVFAPYEGEVEEVSAWEKASRLHRAISEAVDHG